MQRYNFLISTRRWPQALTLPAAQETAACWQRAAEPPRQSRAQCSASQSQQTAAEAVPSTASSNDSAGAALVQWVCSRGGSVRGVTVANLAGRDGGSGWGLKASQELSAGEKLIELPSSCQLTFGPSDDARLLALITQVPDELWGAKLALKLLSLRLQGPDSDFSPYISLLPRGFAGIPMFFGKEAQTAIDYPPVTMQVRKRCRWLADFSQRVLAPLPGTAQDPYDGAAVDINALGWALAAVSSRAFRTRGPSHPAAMLPLIDMCNHSFSPNVEVLPTSNGAVGLFAKRKVELGEPLLLSYGNLSNDFLFMDYGFIMQDNPHDAVQLRFDVGMLQAGALVANVTDAVGGPLELRMTPWKARLLAELGLEGPNANTEVTIRGQAPHWEPRLVAAARVLVASDEAEVTGRSAERLEDLLRPLSKANETAALRTLSGVAAVALSRFTTPLEDDQALLEGRQLVASSETDSNASPAVVPEELSEDVRLSMRFRAEKKRTLSRAIQTCAQLLAVAQASGELKERAAPGVTKKGSKPTPATSKGFGAKKP